jgi:ligand-binding sensor domain-containing protein
MYFPFNPRNDGTSRSFQPLHPHTCGVARHFTTCRRSGKRRSLLYADRRQVDVIHAESDYPQHSPGSRWKGQEGAFRYDGKTVTTFTAKEGLLEDFVGSMIIDRAGNIWLGHPGRFPYSRAGGASRYDGKSFQHFTHEDGLNSTNVYCMLEDDAGNIWFGSVDAGACRYDGKTFTNFSASAPPSLPAQGESK